ncbi:YtxH domain-containing protein [Humibacter sp.]|jgi:hypothetical protein|uniref:YtxH domain-containing protein n=1 Tax=Humibacter sp. TaxID=1940291 RepID=UPI002C0979ED|nr:YtxH domain-containing protein [Humibacter sp.]HVX06834.1 YtxH domain-containing protein [Humibacter sp.]
MKGKVLFVVGLGAGYVLGTRAGRQRYEQIKSAWLKVWDSPAVQKQVHTVQDFTADRIGDLGGMVTENIKRAVTKSKGSASPSAANEADKADAGSSTSASGRSRSSGSGASAGGAKSNGSRRSAGSGGQAS